MVKSLILCEGGDDIGFIKKLCNHLNINTSKIDIKKMSGKNNFFNKENYKTYKQQIEYGEYTKVLFIIDSDDIKDDAEYGGFDNTQNKIIKIISELGFNDIASFYIMCDPDTKNGNLEHLLLSTIEDTKKKCLTDLLDCIEDKEPHKNKKILVSSYEVIFKDSPYNFNHPSFNELIDTIMKLQN